MDRVEVRDGREFVVTEIPPVEPRRRRKPMMTRQMARGAAVGKRLGAGPPTDIDDRRPRRSVACRNDGCGWWGVRLSANALRKPCPWCGGQVFGSR
jgi:hypothetical protein